MSTGRRPTTVVLAALACGLTVIAAVWMGLLGTSQVACFGAGGALTLMILAGGCRHRPDALYPARMQLARFRRTGQPADLVVVDLTASISPDHRRSSGMSTDEVSSVLRVTDGASMVPAMGGKGVCAVLESDARARAAIDRRLRRACGNEIPVAWVSSPDDGVTLEALLEAAMERLPVPQPRPQQRQRLLPLPVQRLVLRSLEPDRGPMRSTH
jgi:hypothetical protein